MEDSTRTDPSPAIRLPIGMITRQILKARTNVTERELRRLEQIGKVRSTAKTKRGWALYPESLVAELVGEKAAGTTRIDYKTSEATEVFELLKRGETLENIVIQTKCHPAVVQQIVRDYEAMAGCLHVPKEILVQIEALDLDGPHPISSPEELLTICANAAQSLVCPNCEKRPKGLCTGCARKSMENRKVAAVEAPEAPSE